MDVLIVKLLQLIPYCVALVILLIITWYALRLFRANMEKTELKPMDYLESFQKLQKEGKLTDEEYRIIREIVSLQNQPKPR